MVFENTYNTNTQENLFHQSPWASHEGVWVSSLDFNDEEDVKQDFIYE